MTTSTRWVRSLYAAILVGGGAAAACGGSNHVSATGLDASNADGAIGVEASGGADASEDGSLADATTGSCPSGQQSCDGVCTDVAVDHDHCGSCSTTCNAGELCSKGVCATSCGAGTTQCGSTCNDLAIDPNNCGACGSACAPGQVCSSGACALSCGGGTTQCGQSCVETTLDTAHCGDCNTVCSTASFCVNGQCTAVCPAEFTVCGSGDAGQAQCVDTNSDRAHCGDCATACAPGQVCNRGQCATSCTLGLVDCAGGCIDPLTSPVYCGATSGCGVDGGSAGQACASGLVCSNGSCQVACPSSQMDCGGTCVDPLSSLAHCGATSGCGLDGGSAGQTCAPGSVCSAGSCQLSCQAGLLNCGGTCIDPLSSLTHCGATSGCGADGGLAGQACAAGYVCSGGACQLSCQAGLVNCAGTCIDPLSSLTFCGATSGCGIDGGSAGQACAPGYVCSSGSCQVTCLTGLIACNGVCINPMSNPRFCGATSGCGVDGGTAGQMCGPEFTCMAGSCQCYPGLVECGGMCIDPLSNPVYCGAKTGCSIDGGTAGQTCSSTQVCKQGQCVCTSSSCLDASADAPLDGPSGTPLDSSSGGGGSAGDGGACTPLLPTSSAVPLTVTTSAQPLPVGGFIATGTYALVNWILYSPPPPDGGDASPLSFGDAGPPTLAEEIFVDLVDGGGQGTFAEAQSYSGGPVSTSAGTLAVSGNQFTILPSCPSGQPTMNWTYSAPTTATGATLRLFTGGEELDFQLVP